MIATHTDERAAAPPAEPKMVSVDPKAAAIAKAKALFDRARSAAGVGSFDYAVEMYLEGLIYEPDNVESHQALREVALARKIKGGVELRKWDAMRLRIPTGDAKQDMLNAAKLMAYEPARLDYMAMVVDSAHKAGLKGTVLWLGPILLKANADNRAPDINKFILLKDVFKSLEQWPIAIEAAGHVKRMRPNDKTLDVEIKSLEGEITGRRQREEAARQAELDRQAEIARKEEEARQAEIARKAEMARKEEEARQAEAARKAEAVRKEEEARRAEQARQQQLAREAEEARLAEIARQAELERQAELARQQEIARQEEIARREEAAQQSKLTREAEMAREAQKAWEDEAKRQDDLAREDEVAPTEDSPEVPAAEETPAVDSPPPAADLGWFTTGGALHEPAQAEAKPASAPVDAHETLALTPWSFELPVLNRPAVLEDLIVHVDPPGAIVAGHAADAESTPAAPESGLSAEEQVIAATEAAIRQADKAAAARDEAGVAQEQTASAHDEAVAAEDGLIAPHEESVVAQDETTCAPEEPALPQEGTIRAEESVIADSDESIVTTAEGAAAPADIAPAELPPEARQVSATVAADELLAALAHAAVANEAIAQRDEPVVESVEPVPALDEAAPPQVETIVAADQAPVAQEEPPAAPFAPPVVDVAPSAIAEEPPPAADEPLAEPDQPTTPAAAAELELEPDSGPLESYSAPLDVISPDIHATAAHSENVVEPAAPPAAEVVAPIAWTAPAELTAPPPPEPEPQPALEPPSAPEPMPATVSWPAVEAVQPAHIEPAPYEPLSPAPPRVEPAPAPVEPPAAAEEVLPAPAPEIEPIAQDRPVDAILDPMQLVEEARLTWEGEATMSNLLAFVDALERTQTQEHEAEAINLLEGMYDHTRQFEFRKHLGRVKMAQLRRMEKSFRQQALANPHDRMKQRQYQQFRLDQLEFELAEFRLWAQKSPADLALRSEIAARVLALRKFWKETIV